MNVGQNTTRPEYDAPVVARLGTLAEMTRGDAFGGNDDGGDFPFDSTS
jgi:hypothetical protein